MSEVLMVWNLLLIISVTVIYDGLIFCELNLWTITCSKSVEHLLAFIEDDLHLIWPLTSDYNSLFTGFLASRNIGFGSPVLSPCWFMQPQPPTPNPTQRLHFLMLILRFQLRFFCFCCFALSLRDFPYILWSQECNIHTHTHTQFFCSRRILQYSSQPFSWK